MNIKITIDRLELTLEGDAADAAAALAQVPGVGRWLTGLTKQSTAAPPAVVIPPPNLPQRPAAAREEPAADDDDDPPGDPPAAAPGKHSRAPARYACEGHPGRTFDVKEAAALAGATDSAVRLAVKKGKAVRGHKFRRLEAGLIPQYDLGGARTRGEAAGDVAPINGARLPARNHP